MDERWSGERRWRSDRGGSANGSRPTHRPVRPDGDESPGRVSGPLGPSTPPVADVSTVHRRSTTPAGTDGDSPVQRDALTSMEEG
jgi:hypothetical protein